MKNKQPSVLVTGGLGYIGSIAVLALENAGYQSVIVDNLSSSNKEVLESMETILGYRPIFWQVDINDEDTFKRVFRNYDFKGVMHFAGKKSRSESCQHPITCFENNVTGSLNLFNLMNINGIRNIVFPSSATVYKGDNILPFQEGQEVGSLNPYSTSKIIVEEILYDLYRFSGFNVINLRHTEPVGVCEIGELGKDISELSENRLFPFMEAATGHKDAVNILGNNHPTKDGTVIRDYIDVNDLIEGFMLSFNHLLENQQDEGMFESFNLGTGKGTSEFELITAIEKVTGQQISYEISEQSENITPEIYCDISKAKSILGWEPSRNIEKSISNTRLSMKGSET